MVRVNFRIILVFLLCLGSLTFFSKTSILFASGSLPALPPDSAFIEQIEPISYPALSAPAEPLLLRWDFSGTQVYPYDFAQQTRMVSEMDGMFGHGERRPTRQSTESKGKLSLKSEGRHIARFVLEDLEVRIDFDLPNSGGTDSKEMRAPPMVIQGIKEDGSMEIGNSSQELLLKSLFPIPPIPLAIGDSVAVPAKMPFNAMGSLLHVTGASETTLADYVLVDGKACAKLETEIDLSTLEIPEELKGEYTCRVRGRSVFYFNVENRHFMSGRVALLISMRVAAPTPEMNFPGETQAADRPKTIKMAMDSDNLISVAFSGN
jgi:hypothetical protein